MWKVTPGWLIDSSSAAREKLSVEATA
jgi:hypothetical protein